MVNRKLVNFTCLGLLFRLLVPYCCDVLILQSQLLLLLFCRFLRRFDCGNP